MFFSTQEIASALSCSSRWVQRRAEREGWPSAELRRAGRNQKIYQLPALPADVQEALAQAEPLSQPAATLGRGGRGKKAPISAEAWEYFLADYLDRRQPSASACYQRLRAMAAKKEWNIPALKTLLRRLKSQFTPAEITLRREGEHALARRYPHQTRTVADLQAMEWINGDGYKPRPNLRWPDGVVSRPVIWAWQDVYSRKILAYRIDRTENADLLRLTLGDLLERWGVPDHCTLDNTRAAANKWLSGGVKNRYRFKVKDEEPLGILPRLGIELHWSSVVAGQGWGQAKPIERAFRDWREYLDKDPAMRKAWDRAHALPLAEYQQAVDRIVASLNARLARGTEIAAGLHSYDQVFAASYEQSVVRKATAEQRRLLLLAAEAVRVDQTGCVALRAGSGPNGLNRYAAESLLAYADQRVVVRFDPAKLHESVEIETVEGKSICTAECLAAVGFGDTQKGRAHARARKQFITATKKAAAAAGQAAEIELPEALETEDPKPGALRLLRLAG